MSALETLLGRTTTSPTVEMSASDLATLLANDRRLAVIQHLADIDGFATLDELSVTIAREEIGGEPDSQARKRVYISLYQNHLDKLANADVVAYDRQGGPVRRGAAFDAVNAAREALQQHSRGDAA